MISPIQSLLSILSCGPWTYDNDEVYLHSSNIRFCFSAISPIAILLSHLRRQSREPRLGVFRLCSQQAKLCCYQYLLSGLDGSPLNKRPCTVFYVCNTRPVERSTPRSQAQTLRELEPRSSLKRRKFSCLEPYIAHTGDTVVFSHVST